MLTGADFTGAMLKDASISGVSAQNVNFTDADLTGADFFDSSSPSDFTGANFTRANLSSADLRYVTLTNAAFTNANLSSADLYAATLTNADFTDALIVGANFEHSTLTLSQLYSTASYKEKNLSGVRLFDFDLRDECFSGFNLNYVSFAEATLAGADFTDSDLTGAYLGNAILTRADFRGATGLSLTWDVTKQAFNHTITGTNVILADGTIGAFDIASGTTLRIKSHEVSAKLRDQRIVSGMLVLEEGATLDVCSNATLHFERGEAHFMASTADNGLIVVKSGGNVKVSQNARIVVDFSGAFTDTLDLAVMCWEPGAIISGFDLIIREGSLEQLVNAHISLMVNGVAYDKTLWEFSTANNALTITVNPSESTKETVVTSSTQSVVLRGADAIGNISPRLTKFSGMISGEGSLHSTGTLDFSGDATLFTGTTHVDAGSFTLAESAGLGTGSFEVAGTLVLKGTRQFSNPVTGFGKIKTNGAITLGDNVNGFTGSLAVASGTLSVAKGKTLNVQNSLSLASGTELKLFAGAEASKVSVASGGSVMLSETAKLVIDFSGTFTEDTRFSVLTWAEGGSVTGLDALTKGGSLSLLVDGIAYDDTLWDFSTSGNALTIFGLSGMIIDPVPPKDPTVPGIPKDILIASSSDNFELAETQTATLAGSLKVFTGTLSGTGILKSENDISFGADASAHSGTTQIVSGTFTLEEPAKLGTGSFEVAGTLAINGVRRFANATNGEGKVSLLSGSDVSFAKSVGVKTLSVDAGATLRGRLEMTHSDAELSLAGALVLNADAGEKVSLGEGSVSLADSATLDLVGNATAFSRARAMLSQIDALESGKKVVIFEAADIDGDIVKFLKTDADLAIYAQDYAVVYDTSNGLFIQVVKNAAKLSGDIDTSAFSSSFVDWAFEDANAAQSSLRSGFVNAEDFGKLSGGDDPLLKAILNGNTESAQAVLERLSPKSYAAMVAMPVEAFSSDVRSIATRLEQRRYDRFAEQAQWEFFAQAQMNLVENDTATDAPTFDFNTTGVLAGADYRLDAETVVGLAVGAGTGEAKVHNGGGKIESMDFRVTGFVGKTIEKCFINAGAQLGYTSYDIKRNTDYGNASGDTTGWCAGLFADAGTVITLAETTHARFRKGAGDAVTLSKMKKICVTPYVGLAYMHTQANAFSESGSDKAFDADAISGDSLRARLGCGFLWNLWSEGVVWHLGLDMAFSHDFLGDEVDVDVTTQSGERIRETAKALPEDVFSIGPTLNVDVSPRASIYGGYTFNAGTDSFVNHSVNLGFRMSF